MTIQVKVRKFASSSVGYMGGDNVSLPRCLSDFDGAEYSVNRDVEIVK